MRTQTNKRAYTHAHTNNATSSLPQIILSNSSLTPAVREHFPRVRSHNQTTEGDQSTRKAKLTKRSLSLPALLSRSCSGLRAQRCSAICWSPWEKLYFFNINKNPLKCLPFCVPQRVLIDSPPPFFSIVSPLSHTFVLLLLTLTLPDMTK